MTDHTHELYSWTTMNHHEPPSGRSKYLIQPISQVNETLTSCLKSKQADANRVAHLDHVKCNVWWGVDGSEGVFAGGWSGIHNDGDDDSDGIKVTSKKKMTTDLVVVSKWRLVFKTFGSALFSMVQRFPKSSNKNSCSCGVKLPTESCRDGRETQPWPFLSVTFRA